MSANSLCPHGHPWWCRECDREFDKDLAEAVAKKLEDPAFAARFCARCRWRDDVHAEHGPKAGCNEFVRKPLSAETT